MNKENKENINKEKTDEKKEEPKVVKKRCYAHTIVTDATRRLQYNPIYEGSSEWGTLFRDV